MSNVEELKNKGNAALQNNNNEEAINYYSQAINLDPNNHILFSNRSAAFSKAGKYNEALEDAEKTISIKKDWAKVCNFYFVLTLIYHFYAKKRVIQEKVQL
jgi:tetratricopeptide (TPR) repeat protein